MALSSSVTSIQFTNDGREAILRIREEDRIKLEKHLFQRYPDREWGTFFKFGFRRTSWGLSISFIEAILPLPGDLRRQSEITEFSSQYNLRAFRAGKEEQIAVGVIHSHPAGFMTRPSLLDDDMDAYFAYEIMHYTNGHPYCSLILQRSDQTGVTFSGRVFDRGQWLPIRTMFTIGEQIEKNTSELLSTSTLSPTHHEYESTTARLSSLLGETSVHRLKSACVGIIGNSGTGTPVGNTLARAGVGNFVVVDPQRISPSNHERTHTTFHEDLCGEAMPYKAALMKRMILAINPAAQVSAFVGNALQENVVDHLLRCDVVIGCTDTVHGRIVLSDLAKHHFLPSIDVAVDMDGREGKLTSQLVQMTRYAPNSPCIFCYGTFNASDMATELMTEKERAIRQAEARVAVERGLDPDAYWRNQRQIHTVGYLTGLAGAMAAGYAEGWLTGAFSMPYPAFQFDIGQPNFSIVQLRANSPNCTCNDHYGQGDLARSFRNVARPSHWRPRAMQV
ncbi:ThiF family adenylyltransferase [Blastopirellula marina]|uniref:THIF-type NAD/FAD binding fold domain-containing protein n=1 Tax=Blastopirellula marina TaxID=124 RepID=A0A2S8F9U0_9BACT|nr:ThiF family adenylyltransferase [Blastopirellula marina]PQO28911.1 hypothetical protein C5Y98_24435 [Blastopirellula marina]PTL42184.1 hypothetical protein C5Y97_24450 [Blastopirellula marina]